MGSSAECGDGLGHVGGPGYDLGVADRVELVGGDPGGKELEPVSAG
jgi:hypothetical protein